MFVLKRPFNAFTLYSLGRCLSAYGLQDILSRLPLRFFTQTSRETKELPESSEERASLFLTRHGIPEQTLAAYLALYPDITGKNTADLLQKTLRFLPSFPSEISQNDTKQCIKLTALFYALCLHYKVPARLAEQFEKFSSETMDLRLEAAALERFNDSFYEDEYVGFVLPDWEKTQKNILVLNNDLNLKPLKETTNGNKTAEGLIRTVNAMILRDGFLTIPSIATCRCDDEGKLYFTHATRSVSFSKQEHQILRSLIRAFMSKNYASAIGALRAIGYQPCPEINLLLKKADEEAANLPLAQKADVLLKCLIQNGLFLPFFIRYAVHALTETENLCLSVLQTTPPWHTAKEEFSLFISTERKEPFKTSETAFFNEVFSFEKHQTERLELQGKKLPSFQQDSSLIPDILYRQTIGAGFKPKHWRLRPIILPIVIFFIIMWLCSKAGFF